MSLRESAYHILVGKVSAGLRSQTNLERNDRLPAQPCSRRTDREARRHYLSCQLCDKVVVK
jgi:hypothetical protein